MKLFYDTCTLLDAQRDAFESNDKFYISSITINELENIKTSGTKDEETKYNARTLLHLLEMYENKYEIVLYKTNYIYAQKIKELLLRLGIILRKSL